MKNLRVERVVEQREQEHADFARTFRSHAMTAWQHREAREAEARERVAGDLAADTIDKARAEAERIEQERIAVVRDLIAQHGRAAVTTILRHAGRELPQCGEETES